MASSADPNDQARVEALVGNPWDKVEALRDRIQDQLVKSFREVESDFLDLLWTIDTYRVEQVTPRAASGSRLKKGSEGGEGIYRSKGNFFSEIITLILSNKTSSPLASRSNVQGFSQLHQIDIAWPARPGKALQDPLICCEAKLTGAPGFGSTPDRKGRADWSNRRKELKFQATDLKLYRQQENTRIQHWDQWRRKAPPLVYTLWAARLSTPEEFAKMIQDAQALTATYLDGVGIYGFMKNSAGDGYVAASISRGVSERVTSMDNVLDLIAAEISDVMESHNNRVPEPVIPSSFAAEASKVDDINASKLF
ncbi:hypothetical protein [Microbacterium sp. AG157]|uniref:hypothetical protein n=1 Tax=Microbacterium sp. AG157 TaxID=2183993 RepID=UPI000E28432A|nr:hypothetical protein [Microbacterium sp. AG157]